MAYSLFMHFLKCLLGYCTGVLLCLDLLYLLHCLHHLLRLLLLPPTEMSTCKTNQDITKRDVYYNCMCVSGRLYMYELILQL